MGLAAGKLVPVVVRLAPATEAEALLTAKVVAAVVDLVALLHVAAGVASEVHVEVAAVGDHPGVERVKVLP